MIVVLRNDAVTAAGLAAMQPDCLAATAWAPDEELMRGLFRESLDTLTFSM